MSVRFEGETLNIVHYGMVSNCRGTCRARYDDPIL